MQRKPGFPVANCSIKMPEGPMMPEAVPTAHEDDVEQRRLQLINFGHSQWGFNNWSWTVTKQDVDFIDFVNGKYCAGVAAFVNITVKSLDIHRENVGYATSVANTKGFAVYKSRKCAVTNALRETLLSFGGSVATELNELLESHRGEWSAPANQPDHAAENNQNVANRVGEPKNCAHSRPPRKEPAEVPLALRSPHPAPPHPAPPPAVKNAPVSAPPAAKPLPLGPPPVPPVPPANRQPLGGVRPAPARPNSNEAAKTAAELNEEEARAERKRRQRQAQEEFRLKQLMKQNTDEKQELSTNSSSFDNLLMAIPTQDIVIEATGEDCTKRKSPGPDGTTPKRRTGSFTKLDIMKD